VFLNGEKVGGDGEFVFDSLQESWMTVSSHAINPVAGRNKLRVNVINYQGAGPEFNPAGLIWRIDVTFTPPA